MASKTSVADYGKMAVKAVRTYLTTLDTKAYNTTRKTIQRAEQRARKAGDIVRAEGIHNKLASMPTPAKLAESLAKDAQKVLAKRMKHVEKTYKKTGQKNRAKNMKQSREQMNSHLRYKKGRELEKNLQALIQSPIPTDKQILDDQQKRFDRMDKDGFAKGRKASDRERLAQKAKEVFGAMMQRYHELGGWQLPSIGDRMDSKDLRDAGRISLFLQTFFAYKDDAQAQGELMTILLEHRGNRIDAQGNEVITPGKKLMLDVIDWHNSRNSISLEDWIDQHRKNKN